MKQGHSLDARNVAHVHEVENARFISETRPVIEVGTGEHGANAAAALGGRDEETGVADLHGPGEPWV